ncbi:MAG: hypothetical protein IJ740_15050 [Ruminococcus sp.]|nr:hypothetical protein [Ruminococcus sp.]
MKAGVSKMISFNGFKFTVNGYRKDNPVRFYLLDNEKNYLTYIILSESNGEKYIDKYINGAKHHFNISNKIDAFYNEIKDLEIEKWNMKTYESSMCWTPPADHWTFDIHIGDISVTCKGEGEVPHNWDKFWKAFNRMCNNG